MWVEQKTLSHTKAVHNKIMFPVQQVAIISASRANFFFFFFLLVGKILSIFGGKKKKKKKKSAVAPF